MRYVIAGILLITFAAAGLSTTAGTSPATLVLDDFENTVDWSAHGADGVELDIQQDSGLEGHSLRIDFRFLKGGGYAVVRKEFDIDLPENYVFTFSIRGEAPRNHLEFKLIDSSGENVWWTVRRDVEFPESWETFRIKRRHIRFAWGPCGGGEIDHVTAVEFSITAGSGGEGSVWIDDFRIEPLPVPDTEPHKIEVTASSSRPGHSPGFALDSDSTTFWWGESEDKRSWIALDFGKAREYGGLTVDWTPGLHAGDYTVEISNDGRNWRTVYTVAGGNGGRDPIYLPETESTYLRLHVSGTGNSDGVALREVTIQPLEWSASRKAFFQSVARGSPRGTYPRALSGEASYWTVVGVDKDSEEGLLNEDGMIETGKGKFSIEPFLWDGRLVGWSDVRAEQSLQEGRLPIPSVQWRTGDLEFNVTAFGTGPHGSSSMIARYRITNLTALSRELTLFLAIRPYEVNPPYQFLNMLGDAARIEAIEAQGSTVFVNGSCGLMSLSSPSEFGAVAFDQGDIVADFLRRGQLPEQPQVVDPFGAASGALAYPIHLPAYGTGEVDIWIPLHNGSAAPVIPDGMSSHSWVEDRFESAIREWKKNIGRVTISLPGSAREITRTLESQLGFILINRSVAAIQPGTRSYDRSWIRDGALTSSALLRLGHPEVVREFIEWFASYQYDNGKVPCCVDDRGSDPVDEHDSAGEFIFLIAEYYRYTGDRSLLNRMWPRVEEAAAYLDSLRQTRRTAEFLEPENKVFFGLLPPSISHEGYSAKPMHSYWDDYFALRGFHDASTIARILGHEESYAELVSIHDEFRTDLLASLEAAIKLHGIDYLPGCADLGDFDPTSTTIALDPVGAGHLLPQKELRRTFEEYYEFFVDRRDHGEWDAFTPYEVRNIGAFVRLGWRDRALELAEYFLSHRRPSGWAQWAEVVRKDERAPVFIGDMPHTWVGSDFIRSVLDMIVYPLEDTGTIVLGAGIQPDWLCEPPGIVVYNLPTPYGPIDFTMSRTGDVIQVRIGGTIRVPAGGIEVRLPPDDSPIRSASVNGKAITPCANGEIVVHEVPAILLIRR